MRSRARGPFPEKQRRALEIAFARICNRAQALEDRVRALELALEVKGLSTQVRRDFREDAIAERQLEVLVFPDQGSVREELVDILSARR
jgi:hypothetical protein